MIKKESFFLDIQTNKLETHAEIFDPKSPGYRHHEPSVGAPHEGVDIQNYWETATLTDEKVQELHGYYSYLVDLHISQVRPNLTEVTYIPDHFI